MSSGDGDRRADPAPEQEPARFPCAGCGAAIEFAPGTDSLVCPRCARRYVVEQRRGGVGERDYFAGLAEAGGDEAPAEVRIATRCEACGARFELAPNVHAAACPYCDSPIVLDSGWKIAGGALLALAVLASAAYLMAHAQP